MKQLGEKPFVCQKKIKKIIQVDFSEGHERSRSIGKVLKRLTICVLG